MGGLRADKKGQTSAKKKHGDSCQKAIAQIQYGGIAMPKTVSDMVPTGTPRTKCDFVAAFRERSREPGIPRLQRLLLFEGLNMVGTALPGLMRRGTRRACRKKARPQRDFSGSGSPHQASFMGREFGSDACRVRPMRGPPSPVVAAGHRRMGTADRIRQRKEEISPRAAGLGR